jgi:sporulation-control protein
MSFFKKVLSSVGIGSAKVDTIIENSQVSPGELVRGQVHVKGGKVEQAINHIKVNVCCNYYYEEEYTETDDDGEEHERTRVIRCVATLASYKIVDAFKTEVDKTTSFDFSIELPFYSPLSLGASKVWLATDLDIASAIDKSDKDTLEVLPTSRQQQLLTAMSELGFSLIEVECEEGRQLGQPFVQEFEFKAHRGPFKGRTNEVEILMVSYPNHLEVLLEVDRKVRGLSGFFAEVSGRDETKLWLDIEDLRQDEVTSLIEEAIGQHC